MFLLKLTSHMSIDQKYYIVDWLVNYVLDSNDEGILNLKRENILEWGL
jgi:hypothetical protein